MTISISKYAKALRSAVRLVAGLVAFVFSSCSLIYTDQEACEFGLQLRFKYDYNMSFGDAFATQVSKVSVYVFDEEGKFVTNRTEEGEALAQDGYRMKMNLPEGKYRFVCWGGKYEESFTHHMLTDDCTPSVELLEALMLRDEENEVKATDGSPLRPIFWGDAKDVYVNPRALQQETISLMKLTNQIKVNLVNGEGETLSTGDFDLHMKGTNGRLCANDACLLEDDLVKYHPYYIADRPAFSTSSTVTKATREGITAEFSCPRMMKDDSDLRLHAIDKNTNKDVLDFPVASILASYAPSSMQIGDYIYVFDKQEYLDRNDLFNLTFIIKDGNWVSVDIQINSWMMRVQNVNL